MLSPDCGVKRRGEEEERPRGAVAELYQQPGDDVELLHHVQQVEEEERAGRPEAGHGDEGVPLPHRGGAPVRARAHRADEAQQVKDLQI